MARGKTALTWFFFGALLFSPAWLLEAHTQAPEETFTDVILPSVASLTILLCGALYALGWWRLRKFSSIASLSRFFLYASALAVVGLALFSSIDRLAYSLFFVHMIQHELILMAAPPLLLLANPLPMLLWGFPKRVRKKLGRILIRRSPIRIGLRTITRMPIAWTLYVVNLWMWHHPDPYGASLKYFWVHEIEHLLFFFTGILFWWPVINPAPRIHGRISYGTRIVYVFLAGAQNTVLAGLIALSGHVIYSHYETAPRIGAWTPLEDQIWGGVIMWIGGTLLHLFSVLWLVAAMLEEEKDHRAISTRPLTLLKPSDNVHG